MTKACNINFLAPWLTELIKNSSEPFVKSGEEMIKYFFELERLLPEKYGWRYYDLDSFRVLIERSKKDSHELNRIYWKDVIRTLEAYSIITYYRANEILRVAITSLNNKEIVPAAILARSILELASLMIENANVLYKTITHLLKKRCSIIIGDAEFESMLLRTIWGTRLGKETPEYLKQKNILTIIQKLSKNPNATALFDKYEFLCELAHPNVLGNIRFWSDEFRINTDGSTTLVIQKKGDSGYNEETIENIVWALGWSASCIRNGYHVLQETILEIEKIFSGLLKHQQ